MGHSPAALVPSCIQAQVGLAWCYALCKQKTRKSHFNIKFFSDTVENFLVLKQRSINKRKFTNKMRELESLRVSQLFPGMSLMSCISKLRNENFFFL